MKIEDFKAGIFRQQPTGYKSFVPNTVDHNFSWNDVTLNTLLEKANLQLRTRH
jgi:hypothetical protein